jgi:Pregnancy-associated plasma protein-A/Secretion system C-terminal sorting domain
MRTILSAVCLFIVTTAFAQRECVSALYTDQQKSIDPSFANKINEIENFVRRQKTAAKMEGEEAPAIIKIPVVVHVLYQTAAQNISDEQIKSQIDALNRDYRRKNVDSVNTPQRFKAFAADVKIEFALATADPNGRATTGIVRKATNVKYWTIDDKIKFSSQGGDAAWDSRYYLNFWVGDLDGSLGYSSVPGAPAEKDGVVINYTAFGTINVGGPYNLGRTATHEVGHWLGLKHIWGDSFCGDDLVDDTPKQGNFTSGCPNAFRSSCSNGSLGDMYMDYMDYTNDACMNLFTEGQKQRMLSLFKAGGPRSSLLSSKGLNQPWNKQPYIEVAPLNTAFKFYPNPAHNEIVLNFDYNADWVGKTIFIANINGIVVSRIQVSSKTQKINLSQLKPGMYFIQGEADGQKLREKFIRL